MTAVAPEDPSVGRRGRRRRGRRGPAWALACAALFACGWGGNQYTPLLELYRSADGWSATVVDALLAAYVFGLIPALLLGSLVSQRYGRRNTVTGAVVSSMAGSALIATGGLAGVAVGRLLSGVGVGLAMAVGTSWATELSVADGAPGPTGAKRAALSLTAGFGAGAGVAGALAQWGPWPESLPFGVHIALSGLVLIGVRRVREAPAASTRRAYGAERVDPLHPSVRRRRLRVLIIPMAPWVFATAAVAYAILPQAMASHLGHYALLYATALTVITLGAGMLAQPVARRLDHPVTPHAMQTAMALVVAGLAAAAAAVIAGNPLIAAAAAVALGGGYGIALLAGLLEVQRIAAPEQLASLTGGYYALSYIGFLLPAVLSYLARAVPLAAELVVLTVVAGACTVVISAHRPRPGAEPGDRRQPTGLTSSNSETTRPLSV